MYVRCRTQLPSKVPPQRAACLLALRKVFPESVYPYGAWRPRYSFVERDFGVVLEALLAFAPEAPDQHEDEEGDEDEQVDGVAGGVHMAIPKAVRRARTAFATLSSLAGAAECVCAFPYTAALPAATVKLVLRRAECDVWIRTGRKYLAGIRANDDACRGDYHLG